MCLGPEYITSEGGTLNMILNISGRNVDTGAAFQEHARETLLAIVEKYFSNAVSGAVTLAKSDSGFEV